MNTLSLSLVELARLNYLLDVACENTRQADLKETAAVIQCKINEIFAQIDENLNNQQS